MFFMPSVTPVSIWVFNLAALIIADSVTILGTLILLRVIPCGILISTLSVSYLRFTKRTPKRSHIALIPLSSHALSALVVVASDSPTKASMPSVLSLSTMASTTKGSVVAPGAQSFVVIKLTLTSALFHVLKASSKSARFRARKTVSIFLEPLTIATLAKQIIIHRSTKILTYLREFKSLSQMIIFDIRIFFL